MGFYATDTTSATAEMPRLHRQTKPHLPQKNRVMGSRRSAATRARFPASEPVDLHQETFDTSTQTVSGLVWWLSRDPLGDSAFLSQYSRGKSRQEKLRLLRRSVDPAYVYVWNSPIGRFDPFGLWPWSRYEEDGNADGSTTITIKKNCTVVVLFGHGLSTKPHSFKFDKPCTAGGFVGCDAGSTNTKIPEGNRIDDAKLTDGELSSGGASGSLPEEEQFGYWLDKAKEGARSKAKAFCKDKSCCCKKVVIYGELAGSAWDMENWAMPGGWDETINCDEVE